MNNSGKKYNWGILGPGRIAAKFASDLALLPNANLYAVGSRSLEKAQNFAKDYHFEKAYGSYQELISDDDLDIVYISTTHNGHYEHSILALENGIAVLCEKPLAINANQVTEMIETAEKNQTFLMEALWTLFLPHLIKVQEIIEEGHIGDVQSVRADFGFKAAFDPEHRLFNPKLGGGALLDIGIYPLLLAQTILGVPDKISATALLGDAQVDEDIGVTLTYKDQKIAHLHSSLRSRTPIDAHIYGTNGYIYLPTPWHKPVSHLLVYDYSNDKEKKYAIPSHGIGYVYEAQAVMDCLNASYLESPRASWEFSLNLVQTMDHIRNQVGVRYPMDD